MRPSFLLALAVAGFVPASAAAQVSGTIVIGGAPVGGVITFGVPYQVGPARRVVVVERYAPTRIVVVERWRGPKHFRRHDAQRYRRSAVWYDRRGGGYYDRARPGFVRVEVYERDGRYYRPDDDDRYRGDERYWGRDR